MYVVACAVNDVERATSPSSARKPTPAQLREILDWLLDAARPIRNRELRNACFVMDWQSRSAPCARQ